MRVLLSVVVACLLKGIMYLFSGTSGADGVLAVIVPAPTLCSPLSAVLLTGWHSAVIIDDSPSVATWGVAIDLCLSPYHLSLSFPLVPHSHQATASHEHAKQERWWHEHQHYAQEDA